MVVDGNEIMNRYNLKPSKKVGELLAIQKNYLFEHPEADEYEIINVLDLAMVDQNGVLSIHKQIYIPCAPSEIAINITI